MLQIEHTLFCYQECIPSFMRILHTEIDSLCFASFMRFIYGVVESPPAVELIGFAVVLVRTRVLVRTSVGSHTDGQLQMALDLATRS